MIWFRLAEFQERLFVFLVHVPDVSVLKVHLHLILATPLSPMFNGRMGIQWWRSSLDT